MAIKTVDSLNFKALEALSLRYVLNNLYSKPGLEAVVQKYLLQNAEAEFSAVNTQLRPFLSNLHMPEYRQTYRITEITLNMIYKKEVDGFQRTDATTFRDLKNRQEYEKAQNLLKIVPAIANQLEGLPDCHDLAEELRNINDLQPVKKANLIRKWLDNHRQQIEQIRTLNLQNLGLTQAPMELNLFTNLHRLYLSYNQLTELPANFLINAANLQWLNLNNNQLTELPANFLINAAHLERLHLNNNRLTELPANFLINAAHLERLGLSYNLLTELPANFLINAAHLLELYLNNNLLTELPANFLINAANLQWLYLSHNRLTELPANFLINAANLQWLYLSHNRLTELPANFLINAAHLQELDLSHNRLTELPANFLINAANLLRLDLENNPLKYQESLFYRQDIVGNLYRNIVRRPPSQNLIFNTMTVAAVLIAITTNFYLSSNRKY
ncbi:MAG: leucine-rich repeat domain-containing protein [Chlamydiales bacterium]|nr:leucine-rich repeat domain-containing protein [Chlamydiales bacterium]